ncbi:MAG: hypothetical protein KAY24_03170, partial [Candidatus Eisenbacteria sp.]|nr:hypothetical protein [Candidatus Eisenbacteria bacterium]
MSSKFISLILAVAVVVGMAVVPLAIPGQVAMASGNVTVEIDPSTTQVLPGGSFTIDAVINNPDGNEVAMHAIRLNFDPTYLTVGSVSLVDFTTDMAPPTIDNVAGHVDYDPNMGVGNSINNTTIISARISCTANASNEGTSTISWVYTSGPPPRQTKVTFGATDYLEGGNMSLMFDGTVMVCTPTLTVNVTPAGMGGVDISGSIPPSYPNVSTWDWDDVVNLLAVDSTPGWGFVNWTGDPVAATNPTTITMDDCTKNVTANFAEQPPAILAVPSSLTFNANVGEDPANQTLDIYNDGGYILNWTLTDGPGWLSVSPTSGGDLGADDHNSTQVAVDITGLTEGTYYANITITGSSTVEVPVTLNLGVPGISVSPTPLTFTTSEGVNPPSQMLEVCNSGTGILDWELTDNAGWLSESPTSGSLGADECEGVTVSVEVSGMEAGDYTATITITGSPTVSVPVTLYIVSAMPDMLVGPAQLSASALDITPQQVEPGRDVTISINVANTGGETGSYNAILYINGVVEASQTVSVAAGISKNVIFTVTKTQAGVYDVALAGQNGQFEVVGGGGWFGGGGLGTGGII